MRHSVFSGAHRPALRSFADTSFGSQNEISGGVLIIILVADFYRIGSVQYGIYGKQSRRHKRCKFHCRDILRRVAIFQVKSSFARNHIPRYSCISSFGITYFGVYDSPSSFAFKSTCIKPSITLFDTTKSVKYLVISALTSACAAAAAAYL